MCLLEVPGTTCLRLLMGKLIGVVYPRKPAAAARLLGQMTGNPFACFSPALLCFLTVPLRVRPKVPNSRQKSTLKH